MEDIVEKSSTGGLDVVFGPEDESNTPTENEMRADDLNISENNGKEPITPVKFGKANSGQLNSKTDDDETEMNDEIK